MWTCLFLLPLFVRVADLEAEACTELANARAADGVRDDAEVDRVLQVAVGICEVDGIEHVEEIEAEFEAHSFVDSRVLGKAEVEAMLHRAAEGVASEAAEPAEG